MSVRRRSITSRLSRDLTLEKGSHEFTRGMFEARGNALLLADKQIRELRGTLSLAEEGLANYAQENQRMRDLLVVASEALSAFTTTYNGRPSRFAEAERASGEIIMAAGDKVDQFLYPDLYSSEPQPREHET